jgi:iron complex outermembrane recepter protein
MRAVKSILFATSGLCFVGMAGAASAQVAGDQSIDAQTSSASTEDEIIVTGIRASNERAQQIKREADSVVNAVTLEDLGKFTDANIGDALQRVPGVQIDRNDSGNSGDRAAVRGLGPLFTAYTVNGRTVFGSGTEGGNELRSLNLDVVAPETISGLIVRKVPTASDPATGLAGQIDVQTLRPLSTGFAKGEKVFGSISARGSYDEFRSAAGPRVSALIGARLADDTVGVYLSGIYGNEPKQRSQYLNGPLFNRLVQLDTNGNRIADAGDQIVTVDAPQGRSANLIEERQKRLGFAGGVQIKPDDRLELYADGFWSRFNNDGTRNRGAPAIQDFTVQAAGGLPGALLDPTRVTISDVAFGTQTRRYLSSAQPGAFITTINGASTSGAFGGGTGTGAQSQIVSADQVFTNKTTIQLYGIGGSYKENSSKVAVDLFYQQTDYAQRFESWNVRKPILTSLTGFDERPRFPIVIGYNDAIADPTGFAGSSGFSRDILMRINTLGGAIDYDYTPDDGGLMSSFKVGVRYTDTDLDRRVSATTSGADSAAVVSSPNYLPSYLSGSAGPRFFPGRSLGLDRFIELDSERLRAAFPGIVGAGINQLGVDPRSSFGVGEKTLAGYARLDFQSGDAFSGNAGIRVVRTSVGTDVTLASTNGQGVVVPGTPVIPFSSSKSDTQFLPSANFSYRPTPDIQLRLGLSRVMSRPELIDLAPVTTVNASLGITPTGTVGVTRGNFDLKPYLANQIDLTFEHYNARGGSIVASLFYKSVSNFIAQRTQANVVIPGLPSVVNGISYTYNLTTPINLTAGKVKGAEIGFDQPLWGALDGFGIQANYTYVDTSVNSSLGVDVSGFPGASKHNVNASAYFDKFGINAQLSMTYRGSYLRNLAGTGTQTSLSRFTEAQTFLNFNASYAITEQIEINAAFLNITKEVRRDYAGAKAYYLDGFDNGRTITFGARYRF